MKKVLFSLIMLSSLCLGIHVNENHNYLRVDAGSNGQDTPTIKYSGEYSVSYYDNIVGLKGDNLLEGLADISIDNHKYYTNYGELRGGLAYCDEDPNDSTKLIDFYTGWSFSNKWITSNDSGYDRGLCWEREHVWPKSLSGNLFTSVGNTDIGAGADIHHLRPEIGTINGDRSNKKFAEVDDTSSNKYYYDNPSTGEQEDTGCYATSSYFEPRKESKGDVARVLMYMYMHYSKEVSNNSSHSYAGNLAITNVVYSASGTSGAWSLLLDWNDLDPVDSIEKQRNDYAASVTGVRNPFIDHPEFATMIWDASYSGDGAINDSQGNVEYTLSLKESATTLEVGDTYQLNPITNVPDATFTYTSSNSTVASVSSNGLILANSKGNATITVECDSLNVTFNVTVNEATSGGNEQTSSSLSYTISDYTKGTQYATNEEHILDDNTTVTTTLCHFTSELRIYSSSTYNGYAIIESQKVISGFEFNAGYKNDTLNIYGSSDGVTYSLIKGVAVTENYADYSVDVAENLNYKYLKLDSAGTNQIRVKSFTLKFVEVSEPDIPTPEPDPLAGVKQELANIETMAQMNYRFMYSEKTTEIATPGYELVTDVADLEVGDTVVIVASGYDYALSTTQNGNNRGQASVTKNNNRVELTNSVQTITLENGNKTGTFAFNVGNGYLYAASSSSNYLRTETSLSNNSSWEITINSQTGVASVVSQGTYTRNILKYNQSSKLFSCYASGNNQKDIVIYKYTEDVSYSTSMEYSDFNNVDMRFQATIPTDLVQYVDSFGIDLKVGEKITNVPISKYSEEENGYSFALVIKNITEYDIEITATPYVVVDGEKISMISKTYSVNTIVEKYINDAASLGLTDSQIESLNAFVALNN